MAWIRSRQIRPGTSHGHLPLSPLSHRAYHTPLRVMEPDSHSHSQLQSETIRDAVRKLDKTMEGYKTIMKESTVGRIETVFQIGGALAEARILFPIIINTLHSTDGPERKNGIRSGKSRV